MWDQEVLDSDCVETKTSAPTSRSYNTYIHLFSRISSIIHHCSTNPCSWEGVDVACQTFLLSSCIALSFHTTRKTRPYPYSLLLGGDRFFQKYVHTYSSFKNLFYHPSLLYQPMLLGGDGCCLSDFSFIILHCSAIPYYSALIHSFGGGGRFLKNIYIYFFEESLLSSFMFVPFHTFRKKPFDHPFLSKGIEFSVFFNSFIYHSSLLYQSMLCGGGGFCMSNFSIFFHPALLCHSILLGNNYSTLIFSFDQELNLYILRFS